MKNQVGGGTLLQPNPHFQTKVTIVGENEIYNWENLIRPLRVRHAGCRRAVCPVGVEWRYHGMLPKSRHRSLSITNAWPIVVFGWNHQCRGVRVGRRAPCASQNIGVTVVCVCLKGVFHRRQHCKAGRTRHFCRGLAVAAKYGLEGVRTKCLELAKADALQVLSGPALRRAALGEMEEVMRCHAPNSASVCA